MRHLRSIVYALVLAPAVWILSGVGFTHDLTGRARDSGSVETVTGLLLLLLAGAAYGILLFAPISPAGPVTFGVVYLIMGIWALAGPSSYADRWPSSVAKPGFDLSLPGYGLAVLLAVPLICTALSARRWARYEPPQIPLIGVLGRPRGAAAVRGTPVGLMHTEILQPYGRDQADPTQVIKLPVGATEVIGSGDATQLVEPPDQTQVVPPTDATQVITASGPEGADDRTELVRLPAPPTAESPTTSDDAEPAAEDDAPVTEAMVTDDAEPATQAIAANDAVLTQAVVANDAEPATEAVVANDGELTTEAIVKDDAEPATRAVVEEPATEAMGEAGVGEPVAATDDAASPVETVDEDESRTELVALDQDDRTELVLPAEEGDKRRTDVIVIVDAEDGTVIYPPEGVEPETDGVESPAAAAEPDLTTPAEAKKAEKAGAEPVVAQAESEAEPVVAQAESEAEPAVAQAESEAEPVVAQAESEAEPVVAQAESEAEEAGVEESEAEASESRLFARLIPDPDADDQDRTQVIRLPAGEVVTHDLRGRIIPAMPPPDERPTRVINRSVMSGTESGERTQVIRVPQPGELRTPAPAVDEGERTQVIRLGAGTVDPPDDRTQVIKLPIQAPARTDPVDDKPAEKPAPIGPSSVMGAERPNFAEDPTTRLTVPKPGDAETQNGSSRTMTVTNLERPADELADDETRPLVPGPRHPEPETN